jgi:hypothetical protein
MEGDMVAGEEKKERMQLPPPGVPVIVKRSGCRCMAVRDRNGKWRDFFHRDELTDVIEVIWAET